MFRRAIHTKFFSNSPIRNSPPHNLIKSFILIAATLPKHTESKPKHCGHFQNTQHIFPYHQQIKQVIKTYTIIKPTPKTYPNKKNLISITPCLLSKNNDNTPITITETFSNRNRHSVSQALSYQTSRNQTPDAYHNGCFPSVYHP